MSNKYLAGIIAGFCVGVAIGATLTDYSYRKAMSEIDLLHKSIEIGNGSRSHSLHEVLAKGNIQFVKESLLTDYQEAKKAANALNLEKRSKENWPFTVDEWFIKNVQNTINQINNPNPCQKSTVAVNNKSSGGCNG